MYCNTMAWRCTQFFMCISYLYESNKFGVPIQFNWQKVPGSGEVLPAGALDEAILRRIGT